MKERLYLTPRSDSALRAIELCDCDGTLQLRLYGADYRLAWKMEAGFHPVPPGIECVRLMLTREDLERLADFVRDSELELTQHEEET